MKRHYSYDIKKRVQKLRKEKFSYNEISKILDIPKSSVYRISNTILQPENKSKKEIILEFSYFMLTMIIFYFILLLIININMLVELILFLNLGSNFNLCHIHKSSLLVLPTVIKV